MANVVRANRDPGVKAGVFGKGLGPSQADIAASELDSDLATDDEAAAAVTFANLDANEDVGTAADQVAAGNHTHA